ncbi:four helix bundle protein [Cyclobacterium jeungdonense]|uniref:Four helix bundle protein n=1 Tax=Cyclobacterium jeungdonense TaxID=708087 RepID=A0ABT8C2I5_9BACT|nr:four helix bundle protein [Cyclobacterium jeungdonense]MDN3686705.1 four helix bundle protein [Cyclobacterium jeungdonense]
MSTLINLKSVNLNSVKVENNNWIKYKIEIRERLRRFALSILALSEKFPKTTRANVINYQVTKSGTSMYANYRAAMRARSKAEFFSKLSIVIEETDETEMWLDLMITSGVLITEEVKDLHQESLELLKILSHMRKRVSAR